MARHPMSFYEAEEDDILHAAWHLTGWYIGTMFPDGEAWIESGQMVESYSVEEQDKVCAGFLPRTIIKANTRSLRSLPPPPDVQVLRTQPAEGPVPQGEGQVPPLEVAPD